MAERMISQAPIQPGAATEADLYTVPSGFEAVVASIVVCNTSPTAGDQFRVRKAPLGAATNVNQSWFADVDLGPKETMILSPAGTLIGTDKIRVRSLSGNVVFDINGTEVA